MERDVLQYHIGKNEEIPYMWVLGVGGSPSLKKGLETLHLPPKDQVLEYGKRWKNKCSFSDNSVSQRAKQGLGPQRQTKLLSQFAKKKQSLKVYLLPTLGSTKSRHERHGEKQRRR